MTLDRQNLNRRDFLKGVTATAGTATAAAVAVVVPTEEAAARGNLTLPPQALGLLFDSTLCVGCKACVTACKIANDKPMTVPPDQPYLDETTDLSHTALNVIKMYTDGSPEVKDRETDGFAFIKHSCMHCVDPSCVSVCPVSAMQKRPGDGVVTYSADACIGCRYCVASCPFRIPRAQYDSATPEIHKCQLCQHLYKDGKFSACADSCPTGATLFGPVEKLLAEAKRRVALAPGTETKFPRRSTETGETTRVRPIARYVPHIYGEKEQGGTQMLMLSGVPFTKLGLPDMPERSYASVSETIQHTLYEGLYLPGAVLAGLMYFTYRSTRTGHDSDGGHDKGGGHVAAEAAKSAPADKADADTAAAVSAPVPVADEPAPVPVPTPPVAAPTPAASPASSYDPNRNSQPGDPR